MCGGPLGRNWHADHVMPHARGGKSSFENYLPCCSICNRARWKSGSKVIRRILMYGIVIRKEVRARTQLGKEFLKRFREDKTVNKKRRN
ncbi:MAG: HNH endonuclease [Nitrospirota bacterium]|nr:HNH endonuclease [Nitrospirota bacterium]